MAAGSRRHRPIPDAAARERRPSTRGALGAAYVEIPAGTELDVRLQTALNSGTAQVEDRFEATTLVDLIVDGRVADSGRLRDARRRHGVEPATRTNRTAKMTVSFDQMTVTAATIRFAERSPRRIEGEGIKGDLPKAGAGAAVGGILGAVLGGGKGAVAGRPHRRRRHDRGDRRQGSRAAAGHGAARPRSTRPSRFRPVVITAR